MQDQDVQSVSVRECTAVDAPRVAALGARLFREAYGPTHPEPELSRYLAREYTAEVFGAAVADDGGFVLVVDGSDGIEIGYTWLRRSPNPPLGVTGTRSAEIVRFYVATERQGQGLGALLMTSCFDAARARGYDAVWLQVWKEAPWAVGFYRKMGFEVVGSASFYFGDQVGDDHVMERKL
jgi:ribosomal protein S18 acetylase RimI-like enzyme